MKHSHIVKGRLIEIIEKVDEVLAENIRMIPMGRHGLETSTQKVNQMLKDRLYEVTTDTSIRKKGIHPLSVPENYDALPYWISGLSQYYIPALEQARILNEVKPDPT